MRIAIYEPDVRMCGPVVAALHIRDAMRSLGHEADFVTSTKSGKASVLWTKPAFGLRWFHTNPDRYVKHDQLAALLNSYDFVILSDIRFTHPDKDALKTDQAPLYAKTMHELQRPWRAMVYGNQYTDCPYLPWLVQAPFFRGLCTVSETAVSFNPDLVSLNERGLISKVAIPYRRQLADEHITGTPERDLTVGYTGRFIYNKGQHVLMLSAEYLASDITVEVWGGCSVGRSESPTYQVFENAMKRGWQVKRYVPPEKQDGRSEHGDVIRPWPWDGRPPGGPLVRYLGNYTSPLGVCLRIGTHVDLSSAKFTAGAVEYSQLEAIDAGCLLVTVPHMSEPWFRLKIVESIVNTPSIKKTLANDDLRKEVAEAVTVCTDLRRSKSPHVQDIVRHNREAILNHDPARWSELLIG